MNQLAGQKQVTRHRLCKLFNIVRSSYYNRLKPKAIKAKRIKLQALVRQAHVTSQGSAGARTIAHIVTKQYGVNLTRYMAGRLMRDMGLQSRQFKQHRYRHAEQAHHIHNNVLERNFAPTAPNQVWTSDVTYIRLGGGFTKQRFSYLAIVLDLYARNIVGFAVSGSPDSQLTARALQMAYEIRLKPKNVLFHTDQGTHYSSKAFAEQVAQCTGMTHSMSRRGNCWDNAPTERFFRSFKTEWMPKNGYVDLQQAQQQISDYIWSYYRCVRPHTFNDYLTPMEKERLFFNQTS